MTDLIRDALERLVNTSEVRDWDTSEARNWQWHVAMCYARQVLADTPRAVLGAQPPADAPSPAPVAWCNSDDFLVAAEKRQSFSGWRERYSDCDMALYAAPTPAPAASTPLDLDALLSPEGAYQRGTGHEDGAQLVSSPHGLEWWAPLYGCDTLDNLLDQLRARILPHLRPPVAGIDVPGVDGDYGGLQELCDAEGVDPRVGVPLLRRARQAWKVAAQPPAPTPAPASDEEREKLASWLENHAAHLRKMESIGALDETELTPAMERAATFLRQSAPAPAPTPVEASEPAAWLWEYIGPNAYAKRCSPVARALHEMNPSNPPYPESWRPIAPLYDFHQPAPAAVPVAVAERPWEREGWCDAEGRCWWSHGPTPTARWNLLPIDGMDDARGWLLPHWAIPIPQPPQGGEVA